LKEKMCLYDWFCDCLYKGRNVIGKIGIPLMLIDLGLSIFIAIQLLEFNAFACCTDNKTQEQCSYDDFGGADNVGVNNGYCYRIDNNVDCGSTLIACAATVPGVDINQLCSQDSLNKVADYNWTWLLGFLVIKMIGLIFVLFLDIKSLCCDSKDAGEKDAQDAERCCSCCKNCTQQCMITTSIFMLRLAFVIFGTVTTFICIWLLQWTDRVWYGSCSALDSTLEKQCNDLIDKCTLENDENYYNVVWQNLSFTGPYWANVTSSVLSSILWIARMAVFRYAYNKTKLIAPV